MASTEKEMDRLLLNHNTNWMNLTSRRKPSPKKERKCKEKITLTVDNLHYYGGCCFGSKSKNIGMFRSKAPMKMTFFPFFHQSSILLLCLHSSSVPPCSKASWCNQVSIPVLSYGSPGCVNVLNHLGKCLSRSKWTNSNFVLEMFLVFVA